MMPPDNLPSAPDFENIAAWVGGVAGLAIVIGGSVFQGVRMAMRIAKAVREMAPEERPTRIVTADTSAMRELAGELERLREDIGELSARFVENNTLLGVMISLQKPKRRVRRKSPPRPPPAATG